MNKKELKALSFITALLGYSIIVAWVSFNAALGIFLIQCSLYGTPQSSSSPSV